MSKSPLQKTETAPADSQKASPATYKTETLFPCTWIEQVCIAYKLDGRLVVSRRRYRADAYHTIGTLCNMNAINPDELTVRDAGGLVYLHNGNSPKVLCVIADGWGNPDAEEKIAAAVMA